MKNKNTISLSRCLIPAVFSLLAFALAARGDDLLDTVLNTSPAPAETNTAPVVSAVDAPTDSAHTAKPTTAESVRAFFSERHPGGNELANSDHIQNPATLSLRGGGGDEATVFCIEYRSPLGNSPFDVSVRGYIAEVHEEWSGRYWSYWYGRQRYESWDNKQRDSEFEVQLLWSPFRGNVLEPFAGAGIRYGTIDGNSEDTEYDPWDRRGTYRGHGSKDFDDSGASLVGRLGLKISLWRGAFLTGEYIVGGDVGDTGGTSELLFDLGLYVTRRMQMHVFVEEVKMKGLADEESLVGDEKSDGTGIAYGAGLSFDF